MAGTQNHEPLKFLGETRGGAATQLLHARDAEVGVGVEREGTPRNGTPR